MGIDFTNETFDQLPLQRQYLLLVAASVFSRLNGKSCIEKEVEAYRTEDDWWGALKHTRVESDWILIPHAKREFVELGYIREIESDGYSPKYIEIDIPDMFLEVVRDGVIFSKASLLDGAWLGTALDNVAKELGALIEDVEDAESVASDDLWEPLKIERSSEALETELGILDAELSKIENDNGYAANEPEERNAILKPARGVWQAIKDGGIPSEEVIKNTLVKPFLYLAKKFADATIGIAAKNIAAWAFKLITGG